MKIGLSLKQRLYLVLAAFLFVQCGMVFSLLADRTAPVLDATGADIKYGQTIQISDLASAVDKRDGEVLPYAASCEPDKGVVFSEDGSSVLFRKAGDFSLEIQASDAAGNKVSQIVPIKVTDNVKPVFNHVEKSYEVGYGKKLKFSSAASSQFDTINLTATDEGSEASLSFSKLVSLPEEVAEEECMIKPDCLVLPKLGLYGVEVVAADLFGNKAYKTIALDVADHTGPDILGADEPLTIDLSDKSYDFLDGITAVDEIQGDEGNSVAVDSSAVKFGKKGTYKVTYAATDALGNKSEKAREVKVDDITPPVLKFAKESYELKVGAAKPVYKSDITASDSDSNATVSIDDSEVDYKTPGTYYLMASAKDAAGNIATEWVPVIIVGASSSDGDSGPSVYITDTGNKYHNAGCRYLKSSSHAISLDEAKSRGYTACKVCKPRG